MSQVFDFPPTVVDPDWIDYVLNETTPDFEGGQIFWHRRLRGRVMGRPLGGKDSNGYIKTQVATVACYVHQLIWIHAHLTAPPRLIDHINRKRDDNRLENLRAVNYSQNMLNSDYCDLVAVRRRKHG